MAEDGIRARHLRAGWMHKLPMSKSTGEKWQRRFFVAKDGFLLYYATGNANASFFDTKPKVRTGLAQWRAGALAGDVACRRFDACDASGMWCSIASALVARLR